MKKNILIITLLIFLTGFSQENPVEISLDTSQIKIGEQFIYKIQVDKNENIIFPKINLNENLEVVEDFAIDTINNKLEKRYLLTGFNNGEFYIPSQQVFIKNQSYSTDSVKISIATIEVDTTKVKKFPLKGIKSEPYQLNDFSHLWWVLLLVLIITGAIIYMVFFHKKKEKETIVKEEPLLPPYEQAIKELQELDKKLLWQNNEIKKYYSELTNIIRTFIEHQFNVPALESTSDDIVKKLSRLHRKKEVIAPNESLKKLNKLLIISDLVKFAKSKPLANEIETDRREAENIINNLKPKPTDKDENVA